MVAALELLLSSDKKKQSGSINKWNGVSKEWWIMWRITKTETLSVILTEIKLLAFRGPVSTFGGEKRNDVRQAAASKRKRAMPCKAEETKF